MKKIFFFFCLILFSALSFSSFGQTSGVRIYKQGSYVEIKEDVIDSLVFLPKVMEARCLYVIGNYQGWNINGNSQTVELKETEYNIYQGYLPANALNQADSYFRFYSELGDWETHSIGYQWDDEGTAVEMSDDNGVISYEGYCCWGKGSWLIDNYPGEGRCAITVDLNNMIVSFVYEPLSF